MTTTKELLQTLNTLRTANGKAELTSWKSSREKLEAAISELRPTSGATPEGMEVSQTTGELQPIANPVASDLTDVEGQTEMTDLTSDAPVQKSPRGAIGALVIKLLVTDMPYEDIVKQVKETYPDAKTTARSIASVAMDLRRDGVPVPSRRKPAAEKPATVPKPATEA